MNQQHKRAIEFALARKARCDEDAAQFRLAYELARTYAYGGDEYNDPTQNDELVAACSGLRNLIDVASAAAKNIAEQAKQLPGYAEYAAEIAESIPAFDFGDAEVAE